MRIQKELDFKTFDGQRLSRRLPALAGVWLAAAAVTAAVALDARIAATHVRGASTCWMQ